MEDKNSNLHEANTPSTSPPEPKSPSVPPPDKSPIQMKNEFEKIIGQYLESNPVIRDGTKTKELEIRF